MHGLWLSGGECLLLRRRLEAGGYGVAVLPYYSVAESMHRVTRRCAHFARRLERRHGLPVHFIGHSLGGLVLYRMFESGYRAGPQSRVVFLGTPANGTLSGRRLGARQVGRRMLGHIAAAEFLQEHRREWHFAPPLGVIAGSKPWGLGTLLGRLGEPSDGTVTVAETQLAGAARHEVLPVSHTGLLLSPTVARHVLQFLDSGRFSRASE